MDKKHSADEETAWPGLPDNMAHRASVKWLTIEALRIVQDRLDQRNLSCSVLLMTSTGYIQGTLADMTPDYETAVAATRADGIDPASASVHLRTELNRMYAKQDESLQPIDNGAIIHVRDAVMRCGGRKLRFPHMAVFASEIVGFTLLPGNVL